MMRWTVVRSGGGAGVRGVGVAVAVVLALVGALHVLWSVSTWPLPDREAFARTVVGTQESQLPSAGMTLAVAGLLFAGAYLVASGAGAAPAIGPRWVHRAGIWTVAAVLTVRGAGGLTTDVVAGVAGEGTTFIAWDAALYSPLCLALGVGAGVVARRGRPR